MEAVLAPAPQSHHTQNRLCDSPESPAAGHHFPPPTYSRLPPDGHEFPQDFIDHQSRKSSTASNSANNKIFIRHDDKSVRSVRDKIALFTKKSLHQSTDDFTAALKDLPSANLTQSKVLTRAYTSSDVRYGRTSVGSGHVPAAPHSSTTSLHHAGGGGGGGPSSSSSSHHHPPAYGRSTSSSHFTSMNSSRGIGFGKQSSLRSQSLLEIGKANSSSNGSSKLNGNGGGDGGKMMSIDKFFDSGPDRIKTKRLFQECIPLPKLESESPKNSPKVKKAATVVVDPEDTKEILSRRSSHSPVSSSSPSTNQQPYVSPTVKRNSQKAITIYSNDNEVEENKKTTTTSNSSRVLKKTSVEAVNNRRNVLESSSPKKSQKSSPPSLAQTKTSSSSSALLVKKTSISEFRAIEARELQGHKISTASSVQNRDQGIVGVQRGTSFSSLGKPASRSSSFTIAERRKSFEKMTQREQLNATTQAAFNSGNTTFSPVAVLNSSGGNGHGGGPPSSRTSSRTSLLTSQDSLKHQQQQPMPTAASTNISHNNHTSSNNQQQQHSQRASISSVYSNPYSSQDSLRSSRSSQESLIAASRILNAKLNQESQQQNQNNRTLSKESLIQSRMSLFETTNGGPSVSESRRNSRDHGISEEESAAIYFANSSRRNSRSDGDGGSRVATPTQNPLNRLPNVDENAAFTLSSSPPPPQNENLPEIGGFKNRLSRQSSLASTGSGSTSTTGVAANQPSRSSTATPTTEKDKIPLPVSSGRSMSVVSKDSGLPDEPCEQPSPSSTQQPPQPSSSMKGSGFCEQKWSTLEKKYNKSDVQKQNSLLAIKAKFSSSSTDETTTKMEKRDSAASLTSPSTAKSIRDLTEKFQEALKAEQPELQQQLPEEQNVESSSNTLPKASFRLGEKTNYYSKDAPKKTAVVSSAKAEENEGIINFIPEESAEWESFDPSVVKPFQPFVVGGPFITGGANSAFTAPGGSNNNPANLIEPPSPFITTDEEEEAEESFTPIVSTVKRKAKVASTQPFVSSTPTASKDGKSDAMRKFSVPIFPSAEVGDESSPSETSGSNEVKMRSKDSSKNPAPSRPSSMVIESAHHQEIKIFEIGNLGERSTNYINYNVGCSASTSRGSSQADLLNGGEEPSPKSPTLLLSPHHNSNSSPLNGNGSGNGGSRSLIATSNSSREILEVLANSTNEHSRILSPPLTQRFSAGVSRTQSNHQTNSGGTAAASTAGNTPQTDRRAVSVNDIRRAFEKAEAALTSASSSSTAPQHHRMSSLDSTTSDESNSIPVTPHYYGSVSSLLSGHSGHNGSGCGRAGSVPDHYGSITSLASSTSLISSQELQGLIDEANQSLEESGTPCHEIMVIVLHREFTAGSIGITLAGGADYENKEITVHKVIPGTLADRDGRIQKGDRVLSINGKSTKGVTHREALSILKAPRAEVVLVLSRGRSVTPAMIGEPDSYSSSAYGYVNFSSGRPPKILESPLDSKSLLSDLKFVDVPRGPPTKVILKKEGTGLGFSLEGGKDSPFGDRPLTIKKIFTGGAADKTKMLKVGDEILSVNNADCSRMSRIEAWNFMKKLPEGFATLVIRQKLNPQQQQASTAPASTSATTTTANATTKTAEDTAGNGPMTVSTPGGSAAASVLSSLESSPSKNGTEPVLASSPVSTENKPAVAEIAESLVEEKTKEAKNED